MSATREALKLSSAGIRETCVVNKELLTDEWSVGGYYRELLLPDLVDAPHANITYGNGILVVALPISAHLIPTTLMLTKVGTDRGEYVGHSGHIEADSTHA